MFYVLCFIFSFNPLEVAIIYGDKKPENKSHNKVVLIF